ncbi:MAG TPA: hypothetical protein VK158_00225 [Acidobacteriota bacterium]|nr:hypothetical protein [Acidobacteriota bacterium]
MILRQQFFFRPRTNTVTPNYRYTKVTNVDYTPKSPEVEVEEDRNIPGRTLSAIVASAYVGVPTKSEFKPQEIVKDSAVLPYVSALLLVGLYLAKKK